MVKNKTTNEMATLNNVQDMISTEINYINLVVKPNMLQGDEEYEFRIDAHDTLHNVNGHAARSSKLIDFHSGEKQDPFSLTQCCPT
jgi:hypothetical protein